MHRFERIKNVKLKLTEQDCCLLASLGFGTSIKKLQPKSFRFFVNLINAMAMVDKANGE